jgi:signal transduction histidine kinase/ActR/RegA family two-component response regulator
MENAQKTLEQRVQELHLVHRQAGAVLEHDQRLQCLEHRLARLQSLTQLNQRISSSLHLHEVLHAIAQAAATLMQALVASFWLANEATQTLEFHACSNERAGADWPLAELSFAPGGAGWVATHRAILNVPNVFADARIAAHHWFRAHGFQSALLIPIVLEDALLAVLTMVRAEPFHLDADDQYLLDHLSAQAAVAIRNARLYRDSENHRRRLMTLVDVTQRLTRGLDLATVLQTIVEAAALVFEGEASLRLLDGNTLVRVAATPGSLASIVWPQVPLGQSLCGHVARSGQPLIVTDMATDPRLFPDVRAALRVAWLKALLCVPVQVGGRVLGTLQVYRERDYLFGQDDLTLATSLADQAAIAMENARLFQEVQDHATQLAEANTALQSEITERQRAEAARQHLEVQLHQGQKMEALGTLAGGIAHDFNNILTVILGYAELSLYDLAPGSNEWHNLQQILIASGRAKHLVQQILAFSRQSEQQRQPVYLHLILEETLTLLRASLPSTIALRQSLATHTGIMLADPVQLQQVVMNLCTNAEYAMRPKGGQLDICLNSVDMDATMAATLPDLRPGPHIRLTVRDTGHGMTPEVLERIFEPFFTTKGPGEGTGMGLAVVHGIITSYAGAITVASTPGQGTTFAIYFPRLPGIVEVTDCTAEILPKGEGHIVFVDDEAALANLAQAMLTRLGYDTEVYTSSRAALAAFQAAPQRFDLVITDQTMPHMTGEALTLALRHIRPDIPIILCTGFSHIMTIEKAGLLGVDAFLMKPLVIHDLGLAIQRVLASRRTAL